MIIFGYHYLNYVFYSKSFVDKNSNMVFLRYFLSSDWKVLLISENNTFHILIKFNPIICITSMSLSINFKFKKLNLDLLTLLYILKESCISRMKAVAPIVIYEKRLITLQDGTINVTLGRAFTARMSVLY